MEHVHHQQAYDWISVISQELCQLTKPPNIDEIRIVPIEAQLCGIGIAISENPQISLMLNPIRCHFFVAALIKTSAFLTQNPEKISPDRTM
jgi:hypothetical protein